MTRRISFAQAHGLTTEREVDTYDHLEATLEHDQPKQVVDIEHVAFLLKPLLEPLVEESARLRHQLKLLIDDLYKSRVFQDTLVMISANIAYELDYKERRFLYIFTPQTVTLNISSGGTIVCTTNNWTPLSLPRGTKITAAAIPDVSPLMVTIRACDEPLSVWAELVSGIATIGNVGSIADYPVGATPVVATSGNGANVTSTATLPAAAGKTTYLAGFTVTGAGATAGNPVIVTVTGAALIQRYIYTFEAGVLVGNKPLIVEFSKPIPADAVNQSIAVACPASGAGGTNNVVNAHGYQL